MAFVLNHKDELTVADQGSSSGAITSENLTYGGFDKKGSIQSNASAPTVPVTAFAYFTQVMTAGAATIDLTSLTNQDGNSVDGTGLKVQFIRFKNPATNSNNITIAVGSSNPYDFFGNADGEATLAPGASVRYDGNETLEDIDGTHKEIDIAGTGTESLQVTVMMG